VKIVTIKRLINTMESKTKKCQNCHKEFIIEPEDFEFYKKIDVPEPTFCPECRMQRRLAWHNEVFPYKRKCDFSGKDIFSMYRPNNSFKVYHEKIWWSDKWDPLEYGRDYDFNRSFFEQFYELLLDVPRLSSLSVGSVNCDYCILTLNSKDCYMALANISENCMYGSYFKSNGCIDCLFASVKNENCYECVDCSNNFNLLFSQYADDCIDSAFLYSCRNCQNCFGCVNLRNKKYYIFNKSYSKENYQKEIAKYDLGKFKDLLRIKKKFEQLKLVLPRKFASIFHSENVNGDNISNAQNCHFCFDALLNIENCKYVFVAGNNLKDSYDLYDVGSGSELIYDSIEVGSGRGSYRVFFSYMVFGSRNIEYSNNCFSSSNLFGCTGLRHKKYCILNKQYTKKEYEKLVSEIKKQMNEFPYIDKNKNIYKYGEFFPIELSLFGYNESKAGEYYPLTKKEAIANGFNWHSSTRQRKYQSTTKAKDLPDDIEKVDKSILKEVIKCASQDCLGSGVFKITPKELKFYKEKKIALPRLCFHCRHRERIKQKYPLKLWERQCMNKGCNNTFQTTYSPDRKEIVYCEDCYNEEVG